MREEGTELYEGPLYQRKRGLSPARGRSRERHGGSSVAEPCGIRFFVRIKLP
ncbi:hypothetical protein HMPREF1986_01939 [Oribacterium sp. oral taxon 078 str. F0263]|nr:hypothetical protein HMPREF1986_01939 [Oribacterium sp. oral taxon 078 str. F0263]